jgi:hypothetical protein
MTWIKYSESTIQLQRALRVPQLPGFSVSGSYVQLAGGGSPVNVYANVPTDGSKTGTITIGSNSFTYTTTTLSETAGSYAITNSSGSYGSNGNGWSSAGVTATSNPAFTYQVGYL